MNALIQPLEGAWRGDREASWSAAVLCRFGFARPRSHEFYRGFGNLSNSESGRGLPHSKTLRAIRLRLGCVAVAVLLLSPQLIKARPTEKIPDKLVVLTFDDAVKSHRTFVAPFLKELGLGATFFVTHKWMDDRTNFMTWQDMKFVRSSIHL